MWNEKKKCSFCNTETLPVRVFLSALLYTSFLYGRLFTLKISILFSFVKRLSFLYEITSGGWDYSASLHFCAFGLLECIVNNQRSKGTWMGREERSTGTENELLVHLMQVQRSHSVQIHSGADVDWGFGAWIRAGGMDLAGQVQPWGCSAARHGQEYFG